MADHVNVTSAEFEALMRRIADGWSVGDPDLAVSCFAPDIVYVEPPDRQHYRGLRAIWELSGGVDPPPMSMTWHHLVFDERKQQGAGEYTFKGRRQYHGLVIVEVHADLIRRWREYQYANELPWSTFIGDSAFHDVGRTEAAS